MRTVAVIVGMVLSLSGIPGAAAAAEDDARVVSELTPDRKVRVTTTASGAIEGRFVAIREGHVVLDHPPGAVPIQAVQTISVQGRATKKGARAGAVVGGLALGTLFGLAGMALCEVESCRDDWPVAAVIGMASGGAVGGLTGALVGAASTQWHTVYVAGPAGRGGELPESLDPVRAGPPGTGRIGSASLRVGFNRSLDAASPEGAAGGLFSLAADFGRVTASFEYGRYGLGSGDVVTWEGVRRPYEESLSHFGPAVTMGRSHGAVRPYALAGVGYYRWTALDPQVLDPQSGVTTPALAREFLGGSLGGGVRFFAASRVSLGVEGRWHTNISAVPQTSIHESERRFHLLSLSAGATFSW